jgi:hypothetical protein
VITMGWDTWTYTTVAGRHTTVLLLLPELLALLMLLEAAPAQTSPPPTFFPGRPPFCQTNTSPGLAPNSPQHPLLLPEEKDRYSFLNPSAQCFSCKACILHWPRPSGPHEWGFCLHMQACEAHHRAWRPPQAARSYIRG